MYHLMDMATYLFEVICVMVNKGKVSNKAQTKIYILLVRERRRKNCLNENKLKHMHF